MSSATSAQALVTQADDNGKAHLVKQRVSIPQPGEHQVLVKITCAAQNPTDVQSLDSNAFGEGAVLGCDFAGTVEATGPSVSRVNKGDNIAAFIWGGEVNGLGAYSEYTIADERICFPVPDDLPLDRAATVPLAACTALLAMFSKDCLNINRSSPGRGQKILIWGGSSSVGLYAVQIAARHNLEIIATCSPKHHDMVKALGATHVFDYRDPRVAERIRQAAPGLKYVFDTIGNETSSETASNAVDAEEEGVLCTVRPGKSFTDKVAKRVKVTDVLVFTAFLKDHKYGSSHYPLNEDDHKLSAEFFDELPKLLSSDELKPNSTKVIEGGLDAVPRGFQEYRDGVISNYKIVYHL